MFAIDHILISNDLLDAEFSCNLGACHGGCCVQGEAGAPLEADERAQLEEVLPRVRKYLSPEALRIIDEKGVWEEIEPGHYVTTCVNNAECVFVTYEGTVAKCAIQRAYQEGRVDFPKPISCHLYPIRVQRYGEVEVLNYEQIELCAPGRKFGARCGVDLADYLREPLIRKYGETWYERFQEIRRARREVVFGVIRE